MKKITFLLFIVCIAFTACTSRTEKLVSVYTDTIGAQPKQEGSVYTWTNLSEEQFYRNGQLLKDKTDKILGLLPSETHDKEVSAATGDIYTSYIWEDTKERVTLWLDYQKGKESIQLIIKTK